MVGGYQQKLIADSSQLIVNKAGRLKKLSRKHEIIKARKLNQVRKRENNQKKPDLSYEEISGFFIYPERNSISQA